MAKFPTFKFPVPKFLAPKLSQPRQSLLPKKPEPVKMVFVIGDDIMLSDVQSHNDKLGLVQGKDYMIFGDGKKPMSQVVKEFHKIKGKVDKDTLFVYHAHGEVDKRDGSNFHMADDDLSTAEVFNKLKIASGLPSIFVAAFSCYIGGIVKRNEVKNGVHILAQGNSKNRSSITNNTNSIEKAISLKFSKKSNLQIFKHLVENVSQTFYWLNASEKMPSKRIVKFSRPGKLTMEEIERIVKTVYSESYAKEVINELKETNQNNKNKKDFSVRGITKLIGQSQLNMLYSGGLLEAIKSEVSKKFRSENLKGYLKERSKAFKGVESILLSKDKNDELMDTIYLELMRDNVELMPLIIKGDQKKLINKEVVKDTATASLMITVTGKDNITLTKFLVRSGANLDDQNVERCTALIAAVQSNNIEEVKFLINCGANLDIQDINNYTALHMAVAESNFEITKLLVEAGANLNLTRKKDGLTPLELAKKINKDPSIIQLLTQAVKDSKAKEKPDQVSLISAIKQGNAKKALSIISSRPDLINEINTDEDDANETPIILAAKNDNLILVQNLIKAGADLNIADDNQRTALTYAAINGNCALAKALTASNRINIDNVDKNGMTAFMHAVNKGDIEMAQILLSAKANLNFIDPKTSNSALILAVANGNFEMIKFLIDKGIDLDVKDHDGRTALDIAQDFNYKQISEYLQARMLWEDEEIKEVKIHVIKPKAPDKKSKDKLEEKHKEIKEVRAPLKKPKNPIKPIVGKTMLSGNNKDKTKLIK